MRDEHGQVTAFVVVSVVGLLLVAGLVVDGGLSLAARLRATDEAEAAARAGARELDIAAYRATGDVSLDDDRAAAAAQDYLALTGHRSTVEVEGDTVRVTVFVSQPTQLLGLVGIGSISVAGRGTARAERGVETSEP